MATNITDTAVLTQPVNVAFQRTLLSNAKARAPYFTGSLPAVIQSNSGTFTASWRRIANLTPTTTALTELNTTLAFPTRDGSQATTTNVQATLGKFGDYVVLSEEADLINFTEQDAKLVEVLGIQAGRSLNMLQRNEMEDNSTAILANGAASATAIVSKITRNDIRKAVNALNRNSAMKFTAMTAGSGNFNTTPVRDSYWGLTHPDAEEDIRDLPGFRATEAYVNQTETVPGEFGAVSAVRFISSEDASIDLEAGGASTGTGLRTGGNTLVDLYNTVVFGMEAFGSLGLDTAHLKEVYRAGDDLPAVQLIRHARGSAGAADALNELSTIGWKSWHAARALNADWSRNIRSGATDL